MAHHTRGFGNGVLLPALAFALAMLAPGGLGTAGDSDTPAAPAAGESSPNFDLAGFGRTLYEQRCSNCHAIDPAANNSIAPPLHNVIGRRAGSAKGYTYSVKLAGSDLVWDTATLDEWLEKSTIATPDIRYRHVGIKDAIERLAVVTFITAANKGSSVGK